MIPEIPESIRTEILTRLERIEAEEGVVILMAIESGSRAWGFASPNSDFDVRFIYAHPKEWYFGIDIEDRRDVIERGIVDDIDLGGWDVRKALRLFWESNPAYVEWIQSPIVYRNQGSLKDASLAAIREVYSPLSGFHHYRSMAKRNYEDHLRGESVSLKKYFYVLRPLLAVRWIEEYGTAAPIEFEKLLWLVSANTHLISEIQKLLEIKRKSPELGMSAPIPLLNEFILTELSRLNSLNLKRSKSEGSLDTLNSIFRSVIT